jgi:ribonuclease HI
MSVDLTKEKVVPSKNITCITINTDASFHPEKKVGGYAFYIVCDLFKIQKGGMFKTQPKTAMEAEMMCMANALHTLLSQKELPSTKWIIINSDCLFSFEKIKRKSQSDIGRRVAEILRKVRIRMSYMGLIKPEFEFRHVKAHNGTNDARSWVNDWCDKEAKKWMRQSVLSINNTK